MQLKKQLQKKDKNIELKKEYIQKLRTQINQLKKENSGQLSLIERQIGIIKGFEEGECKREDEMRKELIIRNLRKKINE